MSEATRAWIYRISTVLIPLLASYGLVEENKVAGIVALVAAVLNTGLASVNTSTKAPSLPPPEA